MTEKIDASPWHRDNHKQLQHILHDLLQLRKEIISRAQSRMTAVGHQWPDETRKVSAVNLCLYLAFRQHDVRPLQEELTQLGLSSLGRGESDILGNIERVINLLMSIFGTNIPDDADFKYSAPAIVGRTLLTERTNRLFGASTSQHYTRIMVTMPTEAAYDYNMVRSLMQTEMACARINCAHDTVDVWTRMVAHVEHAREELRKDCKIFMDLAGVKIRTGALGLHSRGEVKIRLFEGDVFELSCTAKCSVPASVDPITDEQVPAVISCSDDMFMRHVQVGDSVLIDDGILGCIIETVNEHSLLLRVTQASPKGIRIKADKGINFPDTQFDVPALTDKDLGDLDFVCCHADIVGVSFVQSAADLQYVMAELAKRGKTLPVVAKIETKQAVQNLPEILLKGLAYDGDFAIMIARGDLAVELGSVRMAEIQEEILWLCEAAHVPVIWATQVLESLAKKGVVSRPEITDAAMSVRAECVMLNKGAYIVDAANILSQILNRMQAHQYKKVTRLRALRW